MRELQYRVTYRKNGEEGAYRVFESKKNAAIESLRAKGIEVVKVEKLYPFSMERYGHNFSLVHDVSWNRIHDMLDGNIPWDDAEFDRLGDLFDLSGKLMCLETPIAWLTGAELAEARRVSDLGAEHRMGACINAGREDLLQYC